ncbi:MAG: biopolymer transporter ExbD [Lentisphaeria bacterium]|nr:biopolymer transporter ExbD [Lentisphaeria bacterium]
MALRKNRGGKSSVDVPMSAMIDVVFLLLIYFIVTYKEEIPEAHLAINLPQPQDRPSDPETPPQLLEIEIRPTQYLLRNMPMSLDRVESVLTSMAARDPELTVIIKVDQRSKTKNLVGVLDICKNVNLTNLNVVTLQ